MKQQYGQILVTPKPFVKWAGGKRQLISTLNENLPESFGTYFEPFLGGGALLFNMLTENNKQKCIISDLNSDLVLAYATIRDNVDNLISSLKQHEKYYQKDSKSYYYSVRESNPRSEIEKTSRTYKLGNKSQEHNLIDALKIASRKFTKEKTGKKPFTNINIARI